VPTWGGPRRWLVRLAALVLAAHLDLLNPLAVSARSNPAAAVKDIKTFIACLNKIKRMDGSIADVVKCVPPCCNFVVTMSPKSAQAACNLGGCKLPRVIFDCPGPAADKRFRPSFLLCPTDNKGAGGQFGSDRAELGEDVDDKGNMKMGDLPAPPGATDFSKVTEGDVLSKVVPMSDQGTKACNSCHNEPMPGTEGDNQLSDPIDPFGTFSGTELAPFVIDTDEPGRTADPQAKMTLKDVCKCMMKNKDAIQQAANSPPVDPADRNPNLNMKLLLKLCRKLKNKIPRTPACGTPRATFTPRPTRTPTPTPTEPPMPTNTPKDTATIPPPSATVAAPTQTVAPTATQPAIPTNTSIATATIPPPATTVAATQTAVTTPTITPAVTTPPATPP